MRSKLDRKSVLEGTHLLVATGRTPNTEGIGLELAGVELTERGYIKVNERLETTAPDVWAVGIARAVRISPILRSMIFEWSGQSCRRPSCDHGASGPVLHVHRPRAGPDRSQ
jgi:alkyl hydroperoxide reductase subunit AhpF